MPTTCLVLRTLAEKSVLEAVVEELLVQHDQCCPCDEGGECACDNRLLEVARKKLVLLAKRYGITLPQSDARQGPALSRKAGRYAHAGQFKRMRRILRRQRTVQGRVVRDIEHKLDQVGIDVRERIAVWLQHAQQVRAQAPKDKRKLDALHAPEVDCIGKGKARQPYAFGAYAFGAKVGIAVSASKSSIMGARSFSGSPYDGGTPLPSNWIG